MKEKKVRKKERENKKQMHEILNVYIATIRKLLKQVYKQTLHAIQYIGMA